MGCDIHRWVEEGKEMNWRPIATAPTDGTSILISQRYGPVMQASWQEEWDGTYGWRCGRQGAKGYDDTGAYVPTHWKPLPEPPEY